ncbi:TPA: hypothetical protein ACHVEY_002050, partial [Streptococcus suis]
AISSFNPYNRETTEMRTKRNSLLFEFKKNATNIDINATTTDVTKLHNIKHNSTEQKIKDSSKKCLN